MEELTTARLAELKAKNIPHLDVSKMTVTAATDKESEALVTYFESMSEAFAHPAEDGSCLNCGRRVGGFLGAFSWGIRHGEGSCICGWPARAYHFIELPNGESRRISYIIQYHPDGIALSDRESVGG